mmetsp:Transcript_37948/g.70138  ORF Transcript_37948/g.70138 Transcript_37948/m.70138 type:complete len:403 (-) Transcript_37948:215-1423(-)
MPQNQRQSWMLLHTLPVTLLLQLLQRFQKRIHVLLDLRQRLVPELLRNLPLGSLIPLHVRIVECILVPVRLRAALETGQHLGVQHHVHDLRRNIARVVIKQHFGKVHAHVDILGSLGYVHHFAKGGGRGLVQESVPGEEEGGIGRTSVADAQGGVGRDVPRGVHHGILPLVEVHLDVGLGPVVEHVSHGCDGDVAPLPVLVGVRASVNAVEGPLEHLHVVLAVVGHHVHLLQDLPKVVEFDAFQPTQREDQGGEALVAEVRHADAVVVKSREGVEPRRKGRVLLLLVFDEELHEEVEVRDGVLSADSSELIDRRRHSSGGYGVEFGFDGGTGEADARGYEHDGRALGYVGGGDVLPVESVFRVEFEALHFLDAGVDGPFLQRGEVSGGHFIGVDECGEGCCC